MQKTSPASRKRPSSNGRLSGLLRLAGAAALGWYIYAHIRGSSQQLDPLDDELTQSSSYSASLAASASGGVAASATQQTVACPPATIDWRGFMDPGPMFTGSAAIYTTDFTDMTTLWLIYSLQGLGYSVSIYAQPAQAAEAAAFLARGASLGVGHLKGVTVQSVTSDSRGELQGDTVAVFVYICPDDVPAVSGLGTANILIMQPQHSMTATSTHTATSQDPTVTLSSYDFMLYMSSTTYTERLPKLLPILEELQQSDLLFPLVDVLSMPAAPAAAPTAELGITFSMSRYDVHRRRLLVHALTEFSRIHDSSGAAVRLVLCSWLMPGISNDLPFLHQQISSLNISGVFEYRSDTGTIAAYHDVGVQWHLYNPEEKPHFTATAGMPAGIWVLDCTGTLAQLSGVLYGDCPSLNELHSSTLRFIRQPDNTRSSRGRQVIVKSVEAVGGLIRFKMLYLVHRSFSNKIIRYFIRTTQSAYRARITPQVQHMRARKALKLQASKLQAPQRNAAVLVEARPHFAFLYTVLNAAWYLPGWELHVVHSRMNAGFVKRLLEPHVKVTYHLLPADNVDIDDYNGLMKSASFWQMFDAEHVLLFQTDSIILRYGVEQYTKYDYVGAPWHQENERWSLPELRAALPEGVGNGGFSMRSVRAMVEIANNHSSRSPIKEQEDVFFASHIQNHPTLALADRRAAYMFCLEVPCGDLPKPQPLALHAAWYYVDHATLQRLLDTSLMGLLDCELAPRGFSHT